MEDAYWNGARDFAFLALNELHRVRAPRADREVVLALALAVAERGAVTMRDELAPFIGPALASSFPARRRRERARRVVARARAPPPV